MSSMVRISCLLCGSDEAEEIRATGQFGIPIHVCICPNDGLVYLNPRWTQARYRTFYAEEYDRYYRPKAAKEESEARFQPSREIFERLGETGHLPQVASILDIGAGMGRLLEYFRDRLPGIERLGAIEPSEGCLSHLRQERGVDIVATDIDSDWNEVPGNRFDLIVMRHVLEHLLDPVRALALVAGALTESGVAYVSVPNMMAPRGTLDGYWWRAVHTYYFSPATLASTARLASLQPVAIRQSGAEIWAVFRRATDTDPKPAEQLDGEVYRAQRQVLRWYPWRQRLRIPLEVGVRVVRGAQARLGIGRATPPGVSPSVD